MIWVVYHTWTGYQNDGAPVAVYQSNLAEAKKKLSEVFGEIEWEQDDHLSDVWTGTYNPISDGMKRVTSECTLILYPIAQLNTVEFTHVEDDY